MQIDWVGAGFTFVVVYVALAILYMNPWVKEIYKKAERKGIKKWKEVWKPLLIHALSTLSIVIALFYMASSGLSFQDLVIVGLLLRLIPRALETYVQYAVNEKIICIELINGTIAILIISSLAYTFNALLAY